LEKRHRLNKEALLVDHSASQRGRPPAAAVTTPDPTPNLKGKGKTKGKGRGGSEDNASDSEGSDVASVKKIRLIDIAYQDRCCILNLWSKCEEDVENGGCRFGPHTSTVPDIMKKHSFYISTLAENGTPPVAPAKGKGRGRGKGKGKNKDVAPAIPVEEDEEIQ
jgi:hypothetical protein